MKDRELVLSLEEVAAIMAEEPEITAQAYYLYKDCDNRLWRVYEDGTEEEMYGNV